MSLLWQVAGPLAALGAFCLAYLLALELIDACRNPEERSDV